MSILDARPHDLSSDDVCDLADVTYRRLNYWCALGYLGPQHIRPGSGARRRFTSTDLELVDTIRQLHDIGCFQAGPIDDAGRARATAFRSAIDVVRARPVAAGGEYLIVMLDPPRARRHETYLLDDLTTAEPPMWVVRLRSFDTPLQAAAIASVS